MTKTQYILNLIFILPLIVLNFLVYGVDGVIRFAQDITKYSKKYLTNN